MHYTRIAQLRTAEQFLDYCASIGAELPFDATMRPGDEAPLAQPYQYRGQTLGNRFAILPMEGWDGTKDGHPTELTRRRWQRFGQSGAKLIWGGEAVAVRHDGRANANQLRIGEDTVDDLAALRQTLLDAHRQQMGRTDDLLVGLQLTHSGRFSRPNSHALEPRIAYHHPLLDKKFHTEDDPLLRDEEVDALVEDFANAAALAQRAGYAFVDVKHCHGYLGHEFLSAVDRDGKYGGSFENRTRFLRNVVQAVRAAAPGLDIGVRLSAIDWIPFHPDADNVGVPEDYPGEHYPYAFGGDGSGTGIDYSEPKRFLDLMSDLDIGLLCVTVGSPYYVPHIQRPALFPPSDGYDPPEDPLLGVARQIAVTAALKRHRPDLLVVGSGYSYLQEWLPHVAQAVVRQDKADFVGLGRMALAYPEMPVDVLRGNPLQRKHICRTFSDCTTAPRNGLVSGCYPLDGFYKDMPQYETLQQVKKDLR